MQDISSKCCLNLFNQEDQVYLRREYNYKYFLFKNILKLYLFIFKKLFLISIHQNNLKPSKNINLK
jgi:hypothetical protein